jgi:hypothetical protein
VANESIPHALPNNGTFSIRRLENINAEDVELHTGKLASRRCSRLVRHKQLRLTAAKNTSQRGATSAALQFSRWSCGGPSVERKLARQISRRLLDRKTSRPWLHPVRQRRCCEPVLRAAQWSKAAEQRSACNSRPRRERFDSPLSGSDLIGRPST